MPKSKFVIQRKPSSSARLLRAGVLAFGLALAVHGADATTPTGALAIARYSHTAASLPDGRVLIAGGHRTSGSLSSMTTSAEIYDPATGSYTATGALSVARGEHASVQLADGRVLVVGGLAWINGTAVQLDSAEIYDPASGTWSTTGAMSTARRAPTALTLPDGRVLVLGGGSTTTSTEIFDPASGTFSPSGALVVARGKPAAAVLADGRVLLVGGYPASGSSYLASAEIWDPATGVWSLTGSLASARAYASATTLNNGKVIVAGGSSSSGFPAVSELFDPATGTFSASGALNVARQSHSAVRLADGDVLISGGTASTWQIESSNELYDAASGVWRTAGWLSAARNSHALAMLPNGNVLVAGGSPGPVASSEIIYPSCFDAAATLSPSSQSFFSPGGSGSLTLTTAADCGWTITRVPSWMTITSGSTGLGSATVTYSIAAMTTTGGRGATPRIADTDFYVSQTGICSPSTTPTLYPSSQSFTTAAGNGSISVTYDPACAWSVGGVPAWITITAGASGQGSGTVSYAVAANSGAARSATLTIGNRSVVVNQAGVAPVCDPAAVPTISLGGQSFTSSGGSGSVAVTHGAGCSWSVSGVPSWMSITSGASGTQNGTVAYTVAANTGAARSATLTIATKSFNLTQAAASSGCTAVSLSPGVGYSGALAGGDCTSGARGSNYYTDSYFFTGSPGQRVSFQLSSSAFDTYLYLKSPSGSVLTSNDDGGGGTNSRIPATSGYYTLPSSGIYLVEVTSYATFASGAYSLLYTQY